MPGDGGDAAGEKPHCVNSPPIQITLSIPTTPTKTLVYIFPFVPNFKAVRVPISIQSGGAEVFGKSIDAILYMVALELNGNA